MQIPTPPGRAQADNTKPWQHEPDYWAAFDAPFHLIAIRREDGAWSGYVGVPAGDYVVAYDFNGLRVHGGVTGELRGYHRAAAGGLERYRYMGFECRHAGDLVPRRPHRAPGEYRTLDYVIQQLRGAVDQLVSQRSWWWRARRWLRRSPRPWPLGLPPAS